MTNVAIYLRLSDEDRDKKVKTDESESIQNQKSMLREYCIERNWDIYDIYSDEDYSGADKSRPEFNRMLHDCERGKIDIVLCKSQSRFSRDMEMVEKYIHNKFLEWGVRFISIVDHADSNDISNKKARQINGLINEWYLEDASENIRKTLKHKREQGEFTGSFAPYGYIVDPDNKNHLLIDEKVAPVVRDIFNMYIQGYGYRKIVLELNNRGIPSPGLYKRQTNSNFVSTNEVNSYSSGLWTHSTIYRLIRNETYTGTLVQGKSHSISYKNKKRKQVPSEDWIRVPNTHEAIISEDVWQKTQERLNSRLRTKKVTMELSPLSGKVKCAVCGKPMSRNVYHNKAKTKNYYTLQCASYKTGAMNCPNKAGIGWATIEPIIIDKINNLIEIYCNMDEVEIINQQSERLKMLEQTLLNYNEQIKSNDSKIARLYDDKLDGIISTEQYIKYSKIYNDGIADMNDKRQKIEEQIASIKSQQLDLMQNRDIIRQYAHVETLTREVVTEFIDCIYIGEFSENGEREITINWNF